MQRAFLIACSTLLLSTSAQAARVLDEANIAINGEQRRYYHLHDGNTNSATPILVISGSGCKDFGSRVPSFFESYPAPVNVYFLEKTGIQKGDDGKLAPAPTGKPIIWNAASKTTWPSSRKRPE